jgi:hypothetical protein
MNYRNINKMKLKMSHQAARAKATFGFARHTGLTFAKPKEPFFANAQLYSQSNS